MALPGGIEITRSSVGASGDVTSYASCSQPGSTVLTGITSALNEAGYKTNWVMDAAVDPSRPAVVEGTKRSRSVRAAITTDGQGTCQQVVITVKG